ncbi:MAG: ribosomal L7Ae/L30e/S12e/Gadd45 family protein [Bacillota bacterium]|nr:ribosomal L7Ae/L30e/S12e/Gadd45 family protein [Bacillota bacterium]
MDKVMSLLGFGRRARRVLSGEEGIRRAVLRRRARLLVVAEDASPQSRAMYQRLARAGGVSCTIYGRKEELGRALGTSARSAVAILDAGLASAVVQEIGRRSGGEE